jgi:hypothetical protein
LANQVKIAQNGDMLPAASGDSVLSQHIVTTPLKTILYVDLKPEVDSTFDVSYSVTVPQPPSINAPVIGNNTTTFSWTPPRDAEGIAEYWYCIGTAPGDASVLGWLSAGLNTSASVNLSTLTIPSGQPLYISMMSLGTHFLWSNVSFRPLSYGPPPAPMVMDDGAVQYSKTELHARWSEPSSAGTIANYRYAIGTTPGSADIIPWTDAGLTASITSRFKP